MRGGGGGKRKAEVGITAKTEACACGVGDGGREGTHRKSRHTVLPDPLKPRPNCCMPVNSSRP
mgnify:CR=1 FL=1